MIIEFKNIENSSGYIDIDDIDIIGDVSVQSINIQIDKATDNIFTPVLYRIGSITLAVSDNNIYTIDLYGKKITIYIADNNENKLLFRGYICQQAQNNDFNYHIESVNIQICDELTWAKSKLYQGIKYGTFRDILSYIIDEVYSNGILFVEDTFRYNGSVTSLETLVSISIKDNEDVYITDVLERIMQYMCITAIPIDNVLYCVNLSNLDKLAGELYNGDVWQSYNIQRDIIPYTPARTGVTVSMLDPKKSAKITAKFDTWKMTEPQTDELKKEYLKLDYHAVNIAVLQSLATKTDTEYYLYDCQDKGDYAPSTEDPIINYNTAIKGSANLVTSDLQPAVNGSICTYKAGCIHTFSASQEIEEVSADPKGDENFTEGLLLFGLRGMCIRNVSDDWRKYYPMYHKTIIINTTFTKDASLIYTLQMSWQKWREETFKVDYQGQTISGVNFKYPRLLYRIKTDNNTYISRQESEEKVENLNMIGKEYDNTWSVIKPKNAKYPNNYNDVLNLSFDDFWSVADSLGNTIILPKNIYIHSIEVVFLWANQPKYMDDSFRYDSFVASNIFATETWKFDKLNTDNGDTDTEYIWTNDYPQISGDDMTEEAHFPSYDNKNEANNIAYYRSDNGINVVSNICTGAMGDNLHPEEYRLKMYQRQYSLPRFQMTGQIYGQPNINVLIKEPITQKKLRVIGYDYDVLENVSNVNLVEVV